MQINNLCVPNELIEKYCRTIIILEQNFDADLETARRKLHDRIFESVDCHRSLYRKIDREFSLALDRKIRELTTP